MSLDNARIKSVHVDTTLADSDEILVSEFATGAVYIPAGSSLTTFTWWAAVEPGGTFVAVYNSSGAVAQTVSHTRVYPIPDECMACAVLKIAGNADGTIDVSLKE